MTTRCHLQGATAIAWEVLRSYVSTGDGAGAGTGGVGPAQ